MDSFVSYLPGAHTGKRVEADAQALVQPVL